MTFSLGNCTFDDEAILSKGGALECFGPFVALQQTPLTFTSAYKQAASFTGEVGSFFPLIADQCPCGSSRAHTPCKCAQIC